MERKIVSFILHFLTGIRLKYPISKIKMIDPYLSRLSRIVFVFTPITGYPYGNHTITMDRKPYGFQILFYYFYNSLNQRIDIPMDEKIRDFNVLIELLYEEEPLRHSLIPYTANPFPKSLVLL
jgi:hypothetical protein